MRGNSAILKCLIPSFVADFVYVTAWVDSDGVEYLSQNDFKGGKRKKSHLTKKRRWSFSCSLTFFVFLGGKIEKMLRNSEN